MPIDIDLQSELLASGAMNDIRDGVDRDLKALGGADRDGLRADLGKALRWWRGLPAGTNDLPVDILFVADTEERTAAISASVSKLAADIRESIRRGKWYIDEERSYAVVERTRFGPKIGGAPADDAPLHERLAEARCAWMSQRNSAWMDARYAAHARENPS